MFQSRCFQTDSWQCDFLQSKYYRKPTKVKIKNSGVTLWGTIWSLPHALPNPTWPPDITLRNPQGLRIPFGVGPGGGTKLKNKNECTSLLMAETGDGRGVSKWPAQGCQQQTKSRTQIYWIRIQCLSTNHQVFLSYRMLCINIYP